jgi:hypothetical protein
MWNEEVLSCCRVSFQACASKGLGKYEMIAVFRDENQEENTGSVRETRKNGNKDFVSLQIVVNCKMKFRNNFEVDFPGSSQDT